MNSMMRQGLFGTYQRQRGVSAIAVVMALGVITLMMGLAIDTGHVMLNRARLQNALDAAALGAAKVLDQTADQDQARAAGRQIFGDHLVSNANAELSGDLGLGELSLDFTFSDTLSPFSPSIDARKFVRVGIVEGEDSELSTWFLGMAGADSIPVRTTAVAGPSPTLGSVCDIAPIVLCGVEEQSASGIFGYDYGEQVALVLGNETNSEIGPGNFQLLRFDDPGANEVKHNLAGGYEECATVDTHVDTEPGADRGPVVFGINSRFGEPGGNLDPEIYPPDLVTDAGPGGYPDDFYNDYSVDYTNRNYDEPILGKPERRVMAIPFADCSVSINGAGSLPIIGMGCIFLSQPAKLNGQLQSVQVFGQIIENCNARGRPGPDPMVGPGPHTIQLYKDPDRWDS